MTTSNSKITLNVGIDAKRAINNVTGLGNYSRYALHALTMLSGRNNYLLYAPKIDTNHSRIADIATLPNVKLCPPDSAVWRKLSSLWRTGPLANQLQRDGIDVYHGLSNEIPLGLGRTTVAGVVTVHDIIWRIFPGDYSRTDCMMYDFKYGTSIRKANRIIAISECTKKDIVNTYGIDPERIAVIYQGIDPIFRPADSASQADVLKKYGISEPFYIAVGTVQGRKNQLLAVEALRAMKNRLSLVIVGHRTKYARNIDEFIRRRHLENRVIWLENIPLDDLSALYSAASFSAYPSRYEGFGLPVVESIACGTPVIAATGSCLEEAGGPGAIYVDPDDLEQFAAEADKLAENNFARKKLVDAGTRYIRKFTMDNFTRQTVTAYQMALIDKLM